MFQLRCRSCRSPCEPSALALLADVDLADDAPLLRPGQGDQQKAAGQVRTQNLHAVGQEESALELASRDPTVKEVPRLVIGLTAANDELVLLEHHVELIAGEPRHRKRD